MARVEKIGWKQLTISAIGYAILTCVGAAIVVNGIESGFAIVGFFLVAGGGVGASVHVVAAGIRLADEDRARSAAGAHAGDQ